MIYKPSKTLHTLGIRGSECNEAFAMLMTYAKDEFKYTRLDLCIDLELKRTNRIVPILYDKALPDYKGAMLAYLNEEGDTLYCGSRESPIFCRLYDKSNRYNLPVGTVYRAEVEYKKLMAEAVHDSMRKSYNLESFILWAVVTRLKEYGISVPLELRKPSFVPEVKARVTTNDMRIAFLKRQVKGVVTKLQKEGLEREMLEALGLQEFYRSDHIAD
jgi:hypothetical protein